MRTSQRTGVSTFPSRIPQKAGQKSLHLSHADKIETVDGSRTQIKINYEVSN